MNNMAHPRINRQREPLATPIQVFMAVFLGIVLFLITAGLGGALFQLYYLGRIYPGITIGSQSAAGLSPSAAAKNVSADTLYPLKGRIILYNNQDKWIFTPAALGLFLDSEASARNAYVIGRQGTILDQVVEQLGSWFYGQSIPPAFLYDEQMAYNALSEIGKKVDMPVIEASVKVNGTDVSVQQGQVGRKVDIPATLANVTTLMLKQEDGAIPLVIKEEAPKVIDVTAQAEIARRILSEPLVLTMPESQPDQKGPWTFEPPTLASMLGFDYVDVNGKTEYQVTLNSKALIDYLASLAPTLSLNERSARFIFNDSTHQLEVIEPSMIGRTLNVDASVRAIHEKLLKGEHKFSLVFDTKDPPIKDNVTAESLGIRELVHQEISYFYGSSDARIQNITIASKNFHGLLIPPGATFSMAENMGEVSLDNGYSEALIIYGGRTIKGVGGGVCQVSTTLFRAAFFAGFPIVERTPHAYRVSYYEQNAAAQIDPTFAGLDATVFVPLVDLKFTNNTSYWLLMETYVSARNRTITWKFYSTSDGREVEWHTTGPTDVKPAPKPLYRENPDLPQGEVKQVDWEAEGADITVDRVVRRNGEIILQDQVITHYEPWQAVYEYGPGTEGMPPPEEEDQ